MSSTDLVPSNSANFRMRAPLQKWLAEVSPTQNSAVSPGGKIEAIENTKELWAIFDDGYEVQLKSRIASGLVLLRIRELSSREFVQGLQARGFTAGTAYRLMQAAKLYLVLPNLEAIHRASQIEFRSLTELGQLLGDEGFAMLVDGKRVAGITFDEARALSKREIEDLRKEATLKDETIQKLNKQLSDAAHRADMAEMAAKLARGASPDLPPWARTVRAEAACASEAILAALDIAREAFFKAAEMPLEAGMDKATRARHLQSAGQLMHLAIRTCAARAAAFAEEVSSHVGDDQDGYAPVLTKAEIKELEKRRLEILETVRAEYDGRELDRANGKRDGFKKGRGAKRGPRARKTVNR